VALNVAFGLLFCALVGGPGQRGLSAGAPVWEIVHFAHLALIGLIGAVVWLLVDGERRPAATLSRSAAGVFVVLYGAWEATTGLGTTILVASPAVPADVGMPASPAEASTSSYLAALGLIGGASWIAAVGSAAVCVARRPAGMWPAGLLGLGALVVAFDFMPEAGVVGVLSLLAATAARPYAGRLPAGTGSLPAGRGAAPGQGRSGRRIPALGQGAAFASMNLLWAPLRRVLSPDYLFVVYPGTEGEKRVYFPPWVERLLRPLFPAGLMRFGDYWGLVVSGKATAETIEDTPERLGELLAEARAEFPSVQVIAIAGRLPSIAARTGLRLDAPFTQGDRGTLYTMLGAAAEQARVLGVDPREITIAVPGGAGFIGRQLVSHLSPRFARVIALDPRHLGPPRWEGNVLYTDRAGDIAEAEAVLVMTGRGEDAAGLVPFVAAGAVVADDTHPQMPRRVRQGLRAAGATVLRASVSDARFRMTPRLPLLGRYDIPGCLLEALVVLHRGEGVVDSQDAFDRAAGELGFQAKLAPHVDLARSR